jgi:hypothetical protein
MGRAGRAAASLAAIVVVAGLIAVAVGFPRTVGLEAGSSQEANPILSAPIAPSGWTFQASFGSGEGDEGLGVGANLLPPAPRIAIHAVCKGPDELAVFVTTVPPGCIFPTPRLFKRLSLIAAWKGSRVGWR